MSEKRTQRFMLLEENILKPSPTLAPALLQAQQETPGTEGMNPAPVYSRAKLCCFRRWHWGRRGKKSERLG